jgi:hypothetical protein
LRAGQKYCPKKDNFEEALFTEPYLKSTKLAVRRFLAGYTWFVGGGALGWLDNFLWKSAKQVEKLLTKKPVPDSYLWTLIRDKFKFTKDAASKELRQEPTEDDLWELLKAKGITKASLKKEYEKKPIAESDLWNHVTKKFGVGKDELASEYRKKHYSVHEQE